MAVSNLITPVDPSSTYPTVPAGDNRLLFLTVNVAQSSTINATAPTSVSVGGVAMTWVAGDAPGVTQLRTTMSTWMIKESQIASMSGSAITMSGQSGALNRRIAWAVQGASQVTPTRIANGYVSTGAISMSLARVADSWTFLGAFTQVGEDITLTNPSRTSRILNVNIGYAADTAQTVNSTTQSKTYYQTAHVINIDPAPTQSIASINDDDEINAGAVNTAEVVGYVVGVNPVVSGTVGSLALTGVSQTGTGVTFTPPEPTNAAYWPEPDTTQTLTLTDGTNPSTFNAPFRPLAGYISVVVASPDNVDQYKLGYWATTPPVNGDRIMADFTVNPDTSFEGATDGLHIWYHWVNATSTMYIYEATIGGEVIVDNRSLTSPGLVSRGLITRGLVARGL